MHGFVYKLCKNLAFFILWKYKFRLGLDFFSFCKKFKKISFPNLLFLGKIFFQSQGFEKHWKVTTSVIFLFFFSKIETDQNLIIKFR